MKLTNFEVHNFLNSEEECEAYLKEFENDSEEMKKSAENDVRMAIQRINERKI